MPVDFEVRMTEGDKAAVNKRFGAVQELRFYDTKTNNTLFRYAGTLDHWNRLALAIKHGKDLDKLHKKIIKEFPDEKLGLIHEILMEYTRLNDEAKKINDLRGKVQCL